MIARFLIENPDNVVATVKLTMRVSEWCALRDQLETLEEPFTGQMATDHVSDVKNAITELLSEVRKVYYAEQSL